MSFSLQIKRAGARAVARGVSKSGENLKLLALDDNEISENGIDSLKVSSPAESPLLFTADMRRTELGSCSKLQSALNIQHSA